MIKYTYNRKKGEMVTPCPFGQLVPEKLFIFGAGDIIRVGSCACEKCPEYVKTAPSGVLCRSEGQPELVEE